jgi:hypothetical protein
MAPFFFLSCVANLVSHQPIYAEILYYRNNVALMLYTFFGIVHINSYILYFSSSPSRTRTLIYPKMHYTQNNVALTRSLLEISISVWTVVSLRTTQSQPASPVNLAHCAHYKSQHDIWDEPSSRERTPDSLHLRDSPRKRLSRAIPVSSGTNPYNTGIKDELHNIITTSEYNSSAQAGYKSISTKSRKVKHLCSGSIEAKRLQLHRQTRA